jgi:hypothetical protein
VNDNEEEPGAETELGERDSLASVIEKRPPDLPKDG